VGQYPSFFDLFVEIPGTGTILELTSTRLDNPNVTISEWVYLRFYIHNEMQLFILSFFESVLEDFF
jgi:hypothetical protein